MKRLILTSTLALLTFGGTAVADTPSTFSGSCAISGPISPGKPITVLPDGPATFSFSGSGQCSGSLDGASSASVPATLTLTDAQTPFDTCELGPDVNLTGPLTLSADALSQDTFQVTIDLARVAVAGPLRLTTSGGGLAVGTAQFSPSDPMSAPQQCATSGVANASLSASFQTHSPLVGEHSTQ